jgi:large conductance mechanosensitive channel
MVTAGTFALTSGNSDMASLVPAGGGTLIKGFREFIMRGNVVDLAVAVVIGGAFTLVVGALVKDIITPIIAAIAGKPNFAALTFTIHKSKFFYGDFINQVLNFLLVAAAIYFFVIVPIKKMAEIRARRLAAGGAVAAEAEAEASDEVVLLGEIRDLLRSERTP